MTDPSTDEHTLLGLMTKLDFIADIRAAAGDREGRLMQAELVEHIRGLKARADQAEQLRAEMEAMKGACIPSREDAERQQWKGVDGAIAFHLIDRHADSWDEAARMMHAWRDANPPAEVEALRAASVIEWEPGRSYTAAELLRRAIRGLRVRKGRPVWPAVMNLFGVGSTVGHHLCRWAGRDPDTGDAIDATRSDMEITP